MNLRLRTRRAGFTLIEAIVVITLIGIAATFAIPAVGRSVAKTRVQRASATVATDIRTAFAIAARQRRPVRISVDEDAKVFRVQSRAGDTTYVETWYDGSTDLVLRELDADPPNLVVFPGGLAAGGMTVVIRTTPENQRTITANRAGQVRITQP